jgi:hypothetical protein
MRFEIAMEKLAVKVDLNLNHVKAAVYEAPNQAN